LCYDALRYNRRLMMTILHDKVHPAKARNAGSSLEDEPQEHRDFDKGAANKFAIDPYGTAKKAPDREPAPSLNAFAGICGECRPPRGVDHAKARIQQIAAYADTPAPVNPDMRRDRGGNLKNRRQDRRRYRGQYFF
jgi:hypothetical protein